MLCDLGIEEEMKARENLKKKEKNCEDRRRKRERVITEEEVGYNRQSVECASARATYIRKVMKPAFGRCSETANWGKKNHQRFSELSRGPISFLRPRGDSLILYVSWKPCRPPLLR
ncbi:hypothetical protein VNO78_31131 [Psophocarpus tetragonolobus]|uniref:Uncharacterized protein n=1 Tax=Psophocarpus tetragonolobus TaxID=3891 RepID=A0AAN9RYR8_PSOTE